MYHTCEPTASHCFSYHISYHVSEIITEIINSLKPLLGCPWNYLGSWVVTYLGDVFNPIRGIGSAMFLLPSLEWRFAQGLKLTALVIRYFVFHFLGGWGLSVIGKNERFMIIIIKFINKKNCEVTL